MRLPLAVLWPAIFFSNFCSDRPIAKPRFAIVKRKISSFHPGYFFCCLFSPLRHCSSLYKFDFAALVTILSTKNRDRC